MTLARTLAAACATGALLTGCSAVPGADGPPPVVVELPGRTIELDAWSYCYANGCADGMPPEKPTDVGAVEAVRFGFEHEHWEFDATFREPGGGCARQFTVPARQQDGKYVIPAVGPAGQWSVDLFGQGDDGFLRRGGDLSTSFTWTTTVDGDPALLPPARGVASVIADHDGDLDSYGVEFSVSGLAEQPRRASATLSVTAANGQAEVIELRRRRRCYSEGEVAFTGPRASGLRAAAMGDAPFAYSVDLTLDGTSYAGVGTWPDDEVEDESPATALTWTPPLPAYVG